MDEFEKPMTAERDALRVARSTIHASIMTCDKCACTVKSCDRCKLREEVLAQIDAALSQPQASPIGDWWYVVDKKGLAAAYEDESEARANVAAFDSAFPWDAPHRVAQLYEVAPGAAMTPGITITTKELLRRMHSGERYEVAQPEQIAPEKDAEFQRVIEGPVQEEKAAKIMSALIDKLYQLTKYNDRTCDYDVCKEVRDARAYIANQRDTFTPDSAVRARTMHPDYESASCRDVARRVDECIRLRAEIAAKDAEVEKLKMVCGEVYQVIGFIWKHKEDEPMWSDDDLERVLDNLSDASNDNPISHDDLLPWPRQATTNPIAKTFHNP